MEGTATPTATGAFEVVNVDSGKVYHSKLGGGGYVEGAKLRNLLNAALADAEKELAESS